MQMERKVVSVVFCDRHFQHFLSPASVFSSWHYVHYQLQIRLNLVHFQRSTRDTYCILSSLVALLSYRREKENGVKREKE
jgi:hypothetical protein